MPFEPLTVRRGRPRRSALSLSRSLSSSTSLTNTHPPLSSSSLLISLSPSPPPPPPPPPPPQKKIHVHDGGIHQENGTYWWYGTSRKEAPSWLSDSVTLYSSKDLQHWRPHGAILSGSQIRADGHSAPWRIERPKILFNKDTGKYVMLFHLDAPNFSLSSIGVATAPAITGPYTWVRGFKPDGKDSYDMTAFVDPNDGQGYVVTSVENRWMGVFRLNRDFTQTVGPACGSGPRGEAPAVFFPKAKEYHMIASHLTGWSSNQAMQLSRIDTDGKGPCGDWKLGPPPVFGPGEDISYDSQVTYIFPLADPKGSGSPPLWVYLADRWNYEGPLPGSVANATYVWLPILPLKGTENPTQYAVPSVDNWSPSQFYNKTLALSAASLPPARRYSVASPPRGLVDVLESSAAAAAAAASGGAGGDWATQEVPARWVDSAASASERAAVVEAEDEIAAEVDAAREETGREMSERLASADESSAAAEEAAADDFYYVPEEGKQ